MRATRPSSAANIMRIKLRTRVVRHGVDVEAGYIARGRGSVEQFRKQRGIEVSSDVEQYVASIMT